MIGLIVRRLLQMPVILLVIYTITFLLAWSLPGESLLNDEGRRPPQSVIDQMNREYDLDNPYRFYANYLYNASGVRWVVAGVTGGERPRWIFNFGPSFKYDDWSVNELIGSSLPVSIVLGLSTIILALVIGLTAGIIGALRPNSLADLVTLLVALVGISLPSFVIGTALLMLFPLLLGIGGVASWGRLTDVILPAFTLSLPFAAYIARLSRMSMIDALGMDCIRTARAKGLPGRRVVLKHALKIAFLPVLSYLGPAAAFAMTGSFVIEMVFNIPGIGQHFVDAVRNKDLFVIMGVTLIFSAMLIFFNLIVDVLYRWVDPRIE